MATQWAGHEMHTLNGCVLNGVYPAPDPFVRIGSDPATLVTIEVRRVQRCTAACAGRQARCPAGCMRTTPPAPHRAPPPPARPPQAFTEKLLPELALGWDQPLPDPQSHKARLLEKIIKPLKLEVLEPLGLRPPRWLDGPLLDALVQQGFEADGTRTRKDMTVAGEPGGRRSQRRRPSLALPPPDCSLPPPPTPAAGHTACPLRLPPPPQSCPAPTTMTSRA